MGYIIKGFIWNINNKNKNSNISKWSNYQESHQDTKIFLIFEEEKSFCTLPIMLSFTFSIHQVCENKYFQYSFLMYSNPILPFFIHSCLSWLNKFHFSVSLTMVVISEFFHCKEKLTWVYMQIHYVITYVKNLFFIDTVSKWSGIFYL
jgi:hypothetical protein